MAEIYSNFTAGTVGNDPLTDSGTSLSSAGLEFLPVVAAPNFMWLTLDPDGSAAGLPEIVQVTAHSSGATTATIVRGQQGTTNRQHLLGVEWRTGLTKSDTDKFTHRLLTAKGGLIAATAANTPAELAVGADGTVPIATSGESTGIEWRDDFVEKSGDVMSGPLTAPSLMGLSFTVNDDDVQRIDFTGSGDLFGALIIAPNLTTGGSGIASFRANTASAFCSIIARSGDGPVVTGQSGSLTGTTGVDGHLTIAAATGLRTIRIENRTGGTRSYGIHFFMRPQADTFPVLV